MFLNIMGKKCSDLTLGGQVRFPLFTDWAQNPINIRYSPNFIFIENDLYSWDLVYLNRPHAFLFISVSFSRCKTKRIKELLSGIEILYVFKYRMMYLTHSESFYLSLHQINYVPVYCHVLPSAAVCLQLFFLKQFKSNFGRQIVFKKVN